MVKKGLSEGFRGVVVFVFVDKRGVYFFCLGIFIGNHLVNDFDPTWIVFRLLEMVKGGFPLKAVCMYGKWNYREKNVR